MSASIERDDFEDKLNQNESVAFNYDSSGSIHSPESPPALADKCRSIHARPWNKSEPSRTKAITSSQLIALLDRVVAVGP